MRTFPLPLTLSNSYLPTQKVSRVHKLFWLTMPCSQRFSCNKAQSTLILSIRLSKTEVYQTPTLNQNHRRLRGMCEKKGGSVMNDTAQKSPFARLDTSLMRSTKPQPETDTSVKNKETRFQVNQETRNHVSQETSFQENKQARKLGNKEPVKHVNQETSKRVTYPKVTYQLNPSVI